MEVWPFTLPQRLLTNGFAHALGDGLIKDSFNSGPPSYRLRSDAAPQPFSGAMAMTSAEWTIVKVFFHVTLFDGAVSFLFPPQGASDLIGYWRVRFLGAPRLQATGAPDLWTVGLDLEKLGLGGMVLGAPEVVLTNTFFAP